MSNERQAHAQLVAAAEQPKVRIGCPQSIRFARSTSEAFPSERFNAVERYRYSWRWTKPLCEVLFVIALFGSVGVGSFLYLSR